MSHPHAPCLGIEIGGSKLQIVVGRAATGIVDRCRFAVDRAAGGEGIRAQIAAALPALIARWSPAAIGVGYGGPVDFRTGRIAKSYHIAGWSDFPLADWLTERTGLPAIVENDANTAALGEALHGAGRGCSPVLWVNAGSGVGGGLVVDGALYHGAHPGELEIGHLRLERDGTIVEDRCSGWAVDRQIQRAIAADPHSPLAELYAQHGFRDTPPDAPRGEARLLLPALAAGCPVAAGILDFAMSELAFALSHTVQLLHPQVIVFGGGLSLLGAPALTRLTAALPRWTMDVFLPPPEIRLAALGEDAVPIGALALAEEI
jgi:glucokinase